jgi:hypothetical protein
MNSRKDLWTTGSPELFGIQQQGRAFTGMRMGASLHGAGEGQLSKTLLVSGLGFIPVTRESPAGSREAIKRVSVSDGARNSQGFDDGE